MRYKSQLCIYPKQRVFTFEGLVENTHKRRPWCEFTLRLQWRQVCFACSQSSWMGGWNFSGTTESQTGAWASQSGPWKITFKSNCSHDNPHMTSHVGGGTRLISMLPRCLVILQWDKVAYCQVIVLHSLGSDAGWLALICTEFESVSVWLSLATDCRAQHSCPGVFKASTLTWLVQHLI